MPDSIIEKFLILQDRDTRLDHINHQLQRLPEEIKDFEDKIETEKTAIKEHRKLLMQLEVKRKELEIAIGVIEEQIVKYKTQQLQVKKNEEYQALQHEIDGGQSKISDLEDEELEIMIKVDEETEAGKKMKEEGGQNIAENERFIEQLQKNHEAFQTDLKEAQMAQKEAADKIDERNMKTYQYVKNKVNKAPYIVPLSDQRCGGCFLRVSNDVQVGARNPDQLTRCDSCGRIVYLP